jgi:AraC-like DNA-binding protein
MRAQSPAEVAITAFEELHGLHIVVHDLQDRVQLPFARMRHGQALCSQVKEGPQGWRCFDFEVNELRRDWRHWPAGRVHRCHAGFIEWMVPIVEDDVVQAVVFAGQARGDGGCCQLIQASSGLRFGRSALQGLPETTVTHAPLVLEVLRQLAARLAALLSERPAPAVRGRPRRDQIDQFIEFRHQETGLAITDLAAALHLSAGRTAHVVKELYGQTFVEILTATRLRSACDFLRQTEWSVLAVAQAAGFNDLAHFHRVFKRHLGESPGRYRKQASN